MLANFSGGHAGLKALEYLVLGCIGDAHGKPILGHVLMLSTRVDRYVAFRMEQGVHRCRTRVIVAAHGEIAHVVNFVAT